jgi:radical SAM superfamily enzyme YgiQ (UPF0313 family)
MKVTFVALGQEQLPISLLSAVLKREGHTTSLVFDPALFDDRTYLDIPALARIFDRTARVVDEVVAEAPDLVAFSVLTPMYQWALSVAHAVKERIDVPVIFGGVHPSAVPEVCLENSCVDYVCRGEGEVPLVRLCEVLPPADERPAEPIPNMWWVDRGRLVSGPNASFIQELDDLPFWDKGLWDGHIRISDNYMTMASRGCPYRCTFCFNNFYAKLPGKGNSRGYLRRRSVENVIEELLLAKAQWGIRRIDFEDDIFTTNKDWLKSFLHEYRREIDLPFHCLVHPRYIDDDMARWLKDAGCRWVQMGVQSADEEYKRHELLRMEKDAHMTSSLAALESAGLDVKVDHILGLPGEPITAQEEARRLYVAHTPTRIQVFWLKYLPGVELTNAAVARGELDQADLDLINRGQSGHFHAPSTEKTEEAELYRKYELLFRTLPLIPARLRGRVRVERLPRMSVRATSTLTMLCEGLKVIVDRDVEAFTYGRHYLHQFRRRLPEVVVDLVRGRGRLRRVSAPARPSVLPFEVQLAPDEAGCATEAPEAAQPVALELGRRSS